MKRESFIFYRSFYEAICCMPPEVRAEIYPAIIEYALDGRLPDQLSDIAKGVFILVKPNIDVNTARYENGKKGAQYGRRGGRPRKQPDTPKPEPYALTYEQEVDTMRADAPFRDTICADFSITPDQLDRRLTRFLRQCSDDAPRKGRTGHDSLPDAQSHLRYWLSKAYPAPTPSAPASSDDTMPFPDIADDFGALDYNEQ